MDLTDSQSLLLKSRFVQNIVQHANAVNLNGRDIETAANLPSTTHGIRDTDDIEENEDIGDENQSIGQHSDIISPEDADTNIGVVNLEQPPDQEHEDMVETKIKQDVDAKIEMTTDATSGEDTRYIPAAAEEDTEDHKHVLNSTDSNINQAIKKPSLSDREERQLEEAAEAVVKASLAIDEARLAVRHIGAILDKLNSSVNTKESTNARATRALVTCASACEEASLAIEEIVLQCKHGAGSNDHGINISSFIKVEQAEYDDDYRDEDHDFMPGKRKREYDDADVKQEIMEHGGSYFQSGAGVFQTDIQTRIDQLLSGQNTGKRKKIKKKGAPGENRKRNRVARTYNCQHCDYTCSSKLNLTVHSEKHEGVQHKCEDCKFVTESITSLKKHYKLNHEANELFKCAECDYTTKNKYSYKKHMNRQHTNQMFYCDICDYSSKHSNLLKEHKESKHEGLTHPCPHCDHVSTLKRNLKLHIEAVHKNIKYPCELCDYKASQKQTLKFHMERKHSDMKYYCDECPFSATTIVNLRVHKYRIHQEENKINNPLKMHKCEDCDYTTHIKGNLMNHMRKHKGELLYCDQCSYSTWNPPSLKQHTIKNHSSLEYKCDECDAICPNTAILQRHKEVKHLGVMYTCDLENCDFKTPHKYYLSRHKKKAHTEGIQKFICDRCDFTALYPSDLKVHTDAVHDGVRYPCTHCEFTAPRRGDLNKHIRKVHEGLPDGKIFKSPTVLY